MVCQSQPLWRSRQDDCSDGGTEPGTRHGKPERLAEFAIRRPSPGGVLELHASAHRGRTNSPHCPPEDRSAALIHVTPHGPPCLGARTFCHGAKDAPQNSRAIRTDWMEPVCFHTTAAQA